MSETRSGTRRPLALITGASSGIGLELSRLFAADGHDLVLVARSEERLSTIARELEESSGARVRRIPRDLSDPGAPRAIFEELRGSSLEVDALVNNAGYGVLGPFAQVDLEQCLGMIRVNVSALTHLTKLALEDMLPRGRGRILNVASTAAFQPGPMMAVYYATKAYVLSFSEAISSELSGTGVTVTALCPGPTATGFAKAAGMGNPLLFRAGTMDARAVAQAGYRGLLGGRRLVIPGLRNRLLAQAVRVVPRGAVLRIARRLQESRSP